MDCGDPTSISAAYSVLLKGVCTCESCPSYIVDAGMTNRSDKYDNCLPKRDITLDTYPLDLARRIEEEVSEKDDSKEGGNPPDMYFAWVYSMLADAAN